MSSRKKYITNNLNEATYFVVNGLICKKIESNSTWSLFVFENSKALEKRKKKFWSGKGSVNLGKWLSARYSLKEKIKHSSYVNSGEEKKYLDMMGVRYWYCLNGTVQHAIFGKDQAHQNRMNLGNFFLEKQDALKNVRNF